MNKIVYKFKKLIDLFLEKNPSIKKNIESILLVGSILKDDTFANDVDLLFIIQPFKVRIINNISEALYNSIFEIIDKEKNNDKKDNQIFDLNFKPLNNFIFNKMKSIKINLIFNSIELFDNPLYEISNLIKISWMQNHLILYGKDIFENRIITLKAKHLIEGEGGYLYELYLIHKTASLLPFESKKNYILKGYYTIKKIYNRIIDNFLNLFPEYTKSFKFKQIDENLSPLEEFIINLFSKKIEYLSKRDIIEGMENLEEILNNIIKIIKQNFFSRQITYFYEKGKLNKLEKPFDV
ncbi:MAG: hypothetical protein ACTSQP_14360 [Promethearchaeota archaeon]